LALTYILSSKTDICYNKKYVILLVFLIGCIVRIIPELSAYPYPIGYDVISYYLPAVTNFEKHWSVISGQFPLYALVLHLVNVMSGLSPQATVTVLSVMIFGLFAVSVYLVGQKLFRLKISYSIFLTLFVLFQLAVLRTAWDLHRDIFAVLTTFLAFLLIYENTEKKKEDGESKKEKKKSAKKLCVILVAMALSASTVISDGMNGLLFVISLIIYAAMVWSGFTRRIVILCVLIASILFGFSILPSQNMLHVNMERIPSIVNASINSSYCSFSSSSYYYNPTNLLILFIIVNGPLIPTAVVGFRHTDNKNLLKVPLTLSVLFSFSWVLFPYSKSLVADRWIILSGIYLSIFAAYGIAYLVQNSLLVHTFHNHFRYKTIAAPAILLSIMGIIVTTGIAYEVMPYDKPFMLYGMVRNNVESFMPLSMQINTLDVKQNDKLIDVISWINKNTESNAKILGDKLWQGWMEIKLQDSRTYTFSENLADLLSTIIKKDVKSSSNYGANDYLVLHSGRQQEQWTNNINNNNDKLLSLLYSNDIFKLFKIK
jgi:hypothetical protein